MANGGVSETASRSALATWTSTSPVARCGFLLPSSRSTTVPWTVSTCSGRRASGASQRRSPQHVAHQLVECDRPLLARLHVLELRRLAVHPGNVTGAEPVRLLERALHRPPGEVELGAQPGAAGVGGQAELGL